MKLILGLAGLISLVSLSFGQSWPNEIPGSQVVSDWGYNTPTGGGWSGGTSGGIVTVPADQTAGMVSPPYAVHAYRDKTSNHPLSYEYASIPSSGTFFFAFTVRLSNPHFGWFNGQYQKLALIESHNYIRATNFSGGTCRILPYLNSLDNTHLTVPLHEWANAELVENINPTRFALGQWHKVEIFYKASTTTTSRDGILVWWVNGQKIGQYTNLNMNRPSSFKIGNVWDSINGLLPQEEWVDYDHVRISVPPAGALPDMKIPLGITTSTLPSGAASKAYSASLGAQGGKAPYGWTLVSGSLPPGLSLNKSTGVISGTPSSGGLFNFTVKVMDSNVPAGEATKTLKIVVSGSSGVTIPPAAVNAPAEGVAKIFNIRGQEISGAAADTKGYNGVYIITVGKSSTRRIAQRF